MFSVLLEDTFPLLCQDFGIKQEVWDFVYNISSPLLFLIMGQIILLLLLLSFIWRHKGSAVPNKVHEQTMKTVTDNTGQLNGIKIIYAYTHTYIVALGSMV